MHLLFASKIANSPKANEGHLQPVTELFWEGSAGAKEGSNNNEKRRKRVDDDGGASKAMEVREGEDAMYNKVVSSNQKSRLQF